MRGALGCDEVNCHKTSGEELAPLVGAKGFKAYQITGSVGGRSYEGEVLLCPDHSEQMERDIHIGHPRLSFSSFGGGRLKQPRWL